MNRRRSHLGAALVVVALVLGTAACRDDGRTLADAPAPLPTTAPPLVEEVSTSGPSVPFQVSSPALDVDARFDPAVTCDGDNRPPTLLVDGIPAGTAELAVTMVADDPAQTVHWAVAGIAASAATIDEAALAQPGVVSGTTGAGILGWQGPCPTGDELRSYTITVYALAEPLQATPGGDGNELAASLGVVSFAQTAITGFYGRP